MDQDTDHTPALLFDLDGTLIDSVYQHVLAWHEALEELGLSLAVWRIHRSIGMSGGLLVQALGREIGQRITPEQAKELQKKHAAAYEHYQAAIQPLPGARELLRELSRAKVPYAIATSRRPEGARSALEKLGIRTRDSDYHTAGSSTRKARPGSVSYGTCWPRAEPAVWASVLSGGYGKEELEQVGAYRVYLDPADRLAHLDEVGIRIMD
jgi:phosphoglycolate phosphatase-like HAD superfamily hydrolase